MSRNALSPSGYKTFVKCGWAYKLKYVDKAKTADPRYSVQMLLGNIVDETVSALASNMVLGGNVRPSQTDVTCMFRHIMREKMSETVDDVPMMPEDVLEFTDRYLANPTEFNLMNCQLASNGINSSPRYKFKGYEPLKGGAVSKAKTTWAMKVVAALDGCKWFYSVDNPLLDVLDIATKVESQVPIPEIRGFADMVIHTPSRVHGVEIKFEASEWTQSYVGKDIQTVQYDYYLRQLYPSFQFWLADISHSRVVAMADGVDHTPLLDSVKRVQTMVDLELFIPACGAGNHTTGQAVCLCDFASVCSFSPIQKVDS